MKLLSVKPSTISSKKWMAIFQTDSGTTKTVHFGATGYQDYTQHKDKERRQKYQTRHQNDRLTQPDTPGALSYFILWGPSTSRTKNIQLFKNHFHV